MISAISIAVNVGPTNEISQADVGSSNPCGCGLCQRTGMHDRKEIGARIRTARKAKKLKQIELAVAVGISRSHLSNIERGKEPITTDRLQQFAKELDVLAEWLFSGDATADEARLLGAYRATKDKHNRDSVITVAEAFANKSRTTKN